MSTKNLKIAMLAPGSSVHTLRWANAFAARGHTVHLVTQHQPLPGVDTAVKIHHLPHWSGLGYLLNGPRLKRLLNEIRPDVVNAHYASGYGTLARSVGKVPLVLNVWGSDVYDFPARSALHRRWLLANMRHASRIVSTSRAMAIRVSELLPNGPVAKVVPFGVDTELFKPAPIRGNGPMTVGTVKSLAPAYGIDRLIRTFTHLMPTYANTGLRLRIVGDGPKRNELMRLAADLGVADHMAMVGAVPHAQVPDELHKLDVYVALSRSESFGVAVIEASACGLPVVVSDAGGLPEVVRDGVTGFVVPGGDPETAALRIGQLLQDATLRGNMGRAGRAHVLEQYGWNTCVDKQLAILQEVAGR